MTMHPPPKRDHAQSDTAPTEPAQTDESTEQEETPSVKPRNGLTETLHKVPQDDSPKLPQAPEGPEKHPFEGTFDF